MAKANGFRFSTKYQDDETDLLYYGYRFYSAGTGRWLGRDPIEETGGANVYGFVKNYPIGAFDLLGKLQLTLYQNPPLIGFCGHFETWNTWSLDRNTGMSDPVFGGVVVQYVRVSFDIRLCDTAGSPYRFDPPSENRITPDWWPLYEAWSIPPGKSSPARSGYPAYDDAFRMPSFEGTRGSITIWASADYFDGFGVPPYFMPTYMPPTGSLPTSNFFIPPASPTSSVVRVFKASWNCCCTRQKTSLLMN